jgi:TonB-linked SusC/RagA family outer membrane protein
MKKKRLLALIFYAMRLTIVQIALTIAFTCTLYARELHAQEILNKQVSVSVEKIELSKVITKVQNQTGVKFIYSNNSIQADRIISVKIVNKTLVQFIDEILRPINIGYKVVEDKILLFPLPVRERLIPAQSGGYLEFSPQRVISGKVLSSDGQPLQGASVTVKGSAMGTTTDAAGNFKIAVTAADKVLVFSFTGYSTIEKAIVTNNMNVVLTSTEAVIGDVVVTALGISKSARKLGYASTKVGGDLLSVAKESNVAYSLEGRVSGLNISGVNSGPGGSARILIRGITNFTSSTGPLFVIDGVPMDNTQRGAPGVYGGQDAGDGISSINPDDIENMVVLKGSTASALYGVRAANGVIQITTKSGKGSKGIGVELNSNLGINHIVDNTDYQKVYGAGLNGIRPQSLADLTVDNVSSWGEKLDGNPSIEMDGNMYPYKRVLHQKEHFYRTAPVTTNTLSFTSGGEKGNMRFSISYLDNPSVIPNSGLKRYTANLNMDQNIMDKLKLLLMANYVDESMTLRPSLNDMSTNPNFIMDLLPANIDPAYLKPGYNAVTGYENAMSSDGYMPNPWFTVNKVINNSARKRLISSVALRYDLMKGLYIQARNGLDLINDHVLNIEPSGIAYKRQGSLQEQSDAQTTELNMDVLAGYSHPLMNHITLDATAGGNIRKYKYEKIGISGSQWKQPFLYTSTNLVTTTPLYSYQQKQTNSGYYTLDLGYKSFLTVSTTGRYDVFSTLSAGNRGIFTPSVSSSLIFSDFVHIPELSYGKLRLSYAETSGEADPYQTSVYYQIQSGTINNLPYATLEDQVVNTKLTPYRLKEFEAGLELKGFSNRVGLDITYFKRKTEGELISKQISISTGYDYSYEKLGSTQNEGIEVTLNGTVLKQRDFNWNSSFNFTMVNNKLLSIDGTADPSPIMTGQYRPSVGPYNNGAFIASVQGLPISQIMAYDYSYDAKGNIVVGIDGIPQRGNLKAMGSGLPKYYGGFSNDFTYKKFTFSFLIDYKFGNKVLSGTDFFSMYYGLNKKTLPGRDNGVIVKGVTEDGNINNTLVSAQNYYQGLVTNVSTMSVFDGSFIKLRQVTLSYLFSSTLLDKTPFQSVNISLLARNLFTLLKHTDNFDPEDSFSPLSGYAGLEGGTLPQTRTYGINLNFKFKK